jgi:hypothetical protein
MSARRLRHVASAWFNGTLLLSAQGRVRQAVAVMLRLYADAGPTRGIETGLRELTSDRRDCPTERSAGARW